MKAIARARDAGICRRVAALTLDLCIALAVLAFLALLLNRSGLAAALFGEPAVPWRTPAGVTVLLVVLAVAPVVAWRYLGGTPGSLLLGVSVRCAHDGACPGYRRAAARLLLALALAGLGLLWSFRGRPALHDRLTATRAVLEDDALCCLDDFGVRGA